MARARHGTGTGRSRALIRERREAQRRRQTFTAIAVGAVVVVALALLFGLNVLRAANLPGERLSDLGNLHIEEGTRSPIAYNSTPPTSGPHYPSLAEWGVHDETLPDELVVHNLEDGGVGVWYNCPEGCPELVDQLAEVVGQYDEGVLMAPYPGMDTRIALTAWTRIDRFEAFDEERVADFIEAYLGTDHHARP